jgi:hypothetical protein
VSAARLAARAVALLGAPAGPVAIAAPRAARLAAALTLRVALATGSDVPEAAVVALVGTPAAPAARQALLAGLRARLPAGAPLVLIDHNQPRRAWRRALGALRLALGGLSAARARYPAARELAALGFTVDRLRFACGERVQLVLARRP